MKNNLGFCALFSLLIMTAGLFPEIIHLAAEPPAQNQESDKRAATENLERIEQFFRRWERGWFGSRPFYRRELNRCLMESFGLEIVTGRDYLDIRPEAADNSMIHCSFRQCSWLVVRGPVDRQSLIALAGGDVMKLKKWWRSTHLLSIEGRITGFRLEDRPSRAVILKLDKIRFR